MANKLESSPVKDPKKRDLATITNRLFNDPRIRENTDYMDVENNGKRTRVFTRDKSKDHVDQPEDNVKSKSKPGRTKMQKMYPSENKD